MLNGYLPPLLLLTLLLTMASCVGNEPASLGPPDGWEGTETHWWRAGIDTSGVFRNLETLESMGIAEDIDTDLLAASRTVAQRSGVARQQLRQAVRQSLIRIHRNRPEIVDSIFTRHVAPKIDVISLEGNLRNKVDAFKKEGYELIRNHFQEPQTALRLGQDIPVPYPDSLRTQGIGGRVHTQVYLNEEGEPQAIELLESVHPVLDALAMQATTQMRWRPAYLLRQGRWRSIPAWTRFRVRFRVN